METSIGLLNKHSRRNKIGAIIFLILGFIGFLDASYLALESIRGNIPACTILKGCDQVLLSGYAKLGPIPLSYLGVIYYTIVIFGTLFYFDSAKEKVLHAVSAFTMVGILASAYFVYLQFAVIKALCIYCLVSAGISTLMFLNGLFVFIETDPDRPWHHKISEYFRP